jgi:hypothetical protein
MSSESSGGYHTRGVIDDITPETPMQITVDISSLLVRGELSRKRKGVDILVNPSMKIPIRRKFF